MKKYLRIDRLKIFIFSGYLNINIKRLTRNNIFANAMYLKEEKLRGNRGENELKICIRALKCDTRGDRNFISLTNDFVVVV